MHYICFLLWSSKPFKCLLTAFISKFSKPNSSSLTHVPNRLEKRQFDVVDFQWTARKPTRLCYARAVSLYHSLIKANAYCRPALRSSMMFCRKRGSGQFFILLDNTFFHLYLYRMFYPLCSVFSLCCKRFSSSGFIRLVKNKDPTFTWGVQVCICKNFVCWNQTAALSYIIT